MLTPFVPTWKLDIFLEIKSGDNSQQKNDQKNESTNMNIIQSTFMARTVFKVNNILENLGY